MNRRLLEKYQQEAYEELISSSPDGTNPFLVHHLASHRMLEDYLSKRLFGSFIASISDLDGISLIPDATVERGSYWNLYLKFSELCEAEGDVPTARRMWLSVLASRRNRINWDYERSLAAYEREGLILTEEGKQSYLKETFGNRDFYLVALEGYQRFLERVAAHDELEKTKVIVSLAREMKRLKVSRRAVLDKRQLDEKLFWELMETSLRLADGDSERQRDELAALLIKFAPKEVGKFQRLLVKFVNKLAGPKLLSVAQQILRGCTEDQFLDFRAWVVSQGLSSFETARSNAQKLLSTPGSEGVDSGGAEWLLYLASEIHEELTGEDLSERMAAFKF